MSFILAYRKPKAKLARAPSNSASHEDIAKIRSKYSKLLSFEDLPEWYRDNHFTRSGYRPVSNSWIACAQSLGHIHNETVNIYTHLIPAVGFLFGQGIIYHAINHFYPEASLLDQVVFGCYVGAALVTMLISSAYHTLLNHSCR